VRLEKLVFTQCGMPAGPAIGCSVVSVVGGSLVVSLHGQEGAVEEGLLNEMKAYLERKLLGFGKRGRDIGR
jgi:molybdopterin biosynthesis enzyme MoaB